MTPILDNLLLSETFRNDKMRSHEHLYFTLKHSQSNAFFSLNFSALLIIYDILTKCVARVISDWTVLEVQTQERMSLEQTNQWLAPIF